LKKRLQAEEKRMAQERAQLERVEALFQSLKEAIDSHFDASQQQQQPGNITFEQTMVDLADQVCQLRLIVKDTLDAASNFLPSAAKTVTISSGEDEATKSAKMYEQLLKELTILDPEAMAAKENWAQAEAQKELDACLQVASLNDIQMVKALLRPPSQ
jgi:hypothetical protein